MGITIGAKQAKQMLEAAAEPARVLMRDPEQLKAFLEQLEGYLGEISADPDAKEKAARAVTVVRAWSAGERREASRESVTQLLAALIYLEERKDLIPDMLPSIGLSDDFTVLKIAMDQYEAERQADHGAISGV
jgi:uncharacterized membrane protein YkvA (DUF1232 family)